MKILLKNATVFTSNKFEKINVEITDSKITNISENIESKEFDKIFDLKNMNPLFY